MYACVYACVCVCMCVCVYVCGCFACSTRGKLPFHLWALTGLPLGLTHACTIHTSSIISFHSILGSIRADIVSVPGTAAHWFFSRSCRWPLLPSGPAAVGSVPASVCCRGRYQLLPTFQCVAAEFIFFHSQFTASDHVLFVLPTRRYPFFWCPW